MSKGGAGQGKDVLRRGHRVPKEDERPLEGTRYPGN